MNNKNVVHTSFVTPCTIIKCRLSYYYYYFYYCTPIHVIKINSCVCAATDSRFLTERFSHSRMRIRAAVARRIRRSSIIYYASAPTAFYTPRRRRCNIIIMYAAGKTRLDNNSPGYNNVVCQAL